MNLGYGAALRSGFRAARFDLVAFTDGDRQFRVADLGRLTARLRRPDGPTWSSATGSSGRTRSSGPSTRARIGSPTGSSSASGPRRRLRLQAVPARGARGHAGRVGRGVLLGRAAHQAPGAAARRSSRSACPHYPRTAGSATGAKPRVVLRAVRDFWLLRLRLWANRDAALSARRAGPGRHSPRSTAPADSGRRTLAACRHRRVQVERVDEVAEHVEARVGRRSTVATRRSNSSILVAPAIAVIRPDAGPVQDLVGRVDPDAGADRQRERIGRPRIDLDRRGRRLEEEPGVEGLVGQRRDDDPADRDAELVERRANRSWVSGRSGDRPWSCIAIALASHGPDPDRQVAIVVGLLEDHHVLARRACGPERSRRPSPRGCAIAGLSHGHRATGRSAVVSRRRRAAAGRPGRGTRPASRPRTRRYGRRSPPRRRPRRPRARPARR